MVESLRTPLRNPDYAPFLQRVKDAKPDALFLFVPSGEGAAVMKQFADRGLKEAGIKLICTGDVLDDDLLEAIGPAGARRRELAPLLGRARVAREQGVRRALHEGQRRACGRTSFGGRLRRHARDLRGAEARPAATPTARSWSRR